VEDSLPLQGASTASRAISMESCVVDSQHYQVRGTLTTTRADYEDAGRLQRYQNIVVRLTLRFDNAEIVAAEFAMPHGPFAGICERLGLGAQGLVGLRIGKGFRAEVRRRFPRAQTCADLQALLQAMASLIPAIGAMNGAFRTIDEKLPAADVPATLGAMVERHRAAQTCHAWTNEDYGVPAHFARGDYGVVLTPIGRRVTTRWDARDKPKS